jgi:hypothetical protein
MLDPKALSVVVKERQKNIFQQVQRARGPRTVQPANPRLLERLFLRIGDLLISAGLRLHKRYRPATCSGYKAYRSS